MHKLDIPDYGQHCCFVGATGSGKTFLADILLRTKARYLYIDTQDSVIPTDDEMVSTNISSLYALIEADNDKIIYKPDLTQRNKLCWDYVFALLDSSSHKNNLHPRIVYIDEIYHIGYAQSFPLNLPRAITTARQKQIGYWISSQRPANIPKPILTESTYIYAFYLAYEPDIKMLSTLGKDAKMLYNNLYELKKDHSFVIINPGDGKYLRVNRPKFVWRDLKNG